MTGALDSRVWSLCVASAAGAQCSNGSSSAPITTSACSSLLIEMLPMLRHVAFLQQHMLMLDAITSSFAASATSEGSLAATSNTQSELCSSDWMAGEQAPADSVLLLLAASVQSLSRYMSLVNPQSSNNGSDPTPGLIATSNLVHALEATLSLAHALVNNGSWWEEARANHPLLLARTLHAVATVRKHHVFAFHNFCCTSVCATLKVYNGW
jgi:hypothetical protein